MNKTILNSKKVSLLLIAVLTLVSSISHATVFTAVASGNWNSTLTWGGATPPDTLANDQVIVPIGINVMLDNNIVLNSALSQLTVDGNLSSSSSNSITVNSGTVAGSGDIEVSDLIFGTSSTLTFNGIIGVDHFTNWASALLLSADLVADQTLTLAAGNLFIQPGGSLDVGINATITVSGGGMSVNGGNLGLFNNYNVAYTQSSAITGVELSGTGLQDVIIDVSSGNNVTLTSDLMVSGILYLTSGTFILAGNNLSISATGDVVSSNGVINSNSVSNISVNSTNGTSGSLSFAANSSVNDFTVNVGNNNSVQISGSLQINGTLYLTGGSLNFNNASLTIDGNVMGTGKLSGNNTSNLTINTTGGLLGDLSFETNGQTLNNVTINVGSGNSVSLGSDLYIHGTLTLTGASILNISDHMLTLNGDLMGVGSIETNNNSTLVIDGSSSISSDLNLSGSSVGSLAINLGNGNTISLGANANVSGTFNLQSGTLILNGYNLNISGDIAANGTGVISSNEGSNVSVTTGSTPSGSLSFLGADDTTFSISNFTVNVGATGSLNLGSELYVFGTLNLVSGYINLNGNYLEIESTGSITGTGANSYIIADNGGTLGFDLEASSGTWTTFPIGTSTQYTPAEANLNANSASGFVTVGVDNNVLTQGDAGFDLSATQPLVDATWFVESEITANLSLNLKFIWPTSIEVNSFDHTNAYVSHYTAGHWDMGTIAAANDEGNSMFSVERTDVTSLSPFAVFDQNTSTGINTLVNDNSYFDVYPNPSTDYIMIKNNRALGEVFNIDIIDEGGRVVASQTIRDNNSTIAVDKLTKGNYLLKLYNDKSYAVKPFTKM